MGLFGLTTEVLTEYKVDAGEHKRALRELKALEEELGATEGKAAAERNEQLNEWLEKLGKLTLAIVAVKEVGEVIWDGYKEGLHEAKLETAAMGMDFEALSAAAGGLKTHLELLEFAAKAQSSAFHNTQEDMEVAERAIRKLEARGVPTADAVDAITNAVVSAKVKGLVPLGLVIDSHLGQLAQLDEANLSAAQKTELHSRAMEALKKFTEGTDDAQENLGDSMAKAGVELKNSWADLKIALGELASAFAPLLKAIGAAIEGYADLAHFLTMGNPLSIESIQYQMSHGRVTVDDTQEKADPRKKAWGSYTIDPKAEEKAHAEHVKFMNEESLRAAREAAAAEKKAAEEELRLNEKIFEEHIKRLAQSMDTSKSSAGWKSLEDVQWRAHQAEDDSNYRRYFDQRNEQDSRGARHDAFDQKQFGERETLLKKTFGPVGDFDLYKKGFDALTGAMGNMYDAMVAGSEPATQAIQKAIAASVEAVGKQMMVESIKEGAYALGDLAIGNFAGAGTHATAAAEFAAGAVIAGVVASQLGFGGKGGASSAGSSSSSGARAPNTTSSSSHNNGGPIIVYGDSFADDSPYMKQIRARELVGKALGTSAVSFN